MMPLPQTSSGGRVKIGLKLSELTESFLNFRKENQNNLKNLLTKDFGQMTTGERLAAVDIMGGFGGAGMIKKVGTGVASTAFEGFKDLTTKVLEKLKGRSAVSKQFIEDLSNSADLKQPERDLIRGVLKDSTDIVNVKDFANKVKSELLPLSPSHLKDGRYENIALPGDLRGPIAEYMERIYSSPIKTSAGDVHYSGEYPNANYFAHTRIEDLPDSATIKKLTSANDKALTDAEFEAYKTAEKGGSTRRVIELQSDLFQKGRLESENPQARRAIGATYSSPEGKARVEAEITARDAELSKLEPYRNTWHERLIREEIKQAAKDGKTKLQFPTGETAMKIEGLGQGNSWTMADRTQPLRPENLKVGMEVNQSAYMGNEWIITDVLGDGKFKAVPQSALRNVTGETITEKLRTGQLSNYTETFDISGKMDTNNPIYKFYEKEVGRYLANKYGAKRVKDAQGVEWYEIPIKKEMGKLPIEAYGIGLALGGSIAPEIGDPSPQKR